MQKKKNILQNLLIIFVRSVIKLSPLRVSWKSTRSFMWRSVFPARSVTRSSRRNGPMTNTWVRSTASSWRSPRVQSAARSSRLPTSCWPTSSRITRNKRSSGVLSALSTSTRNTTWWHISTPGTRRRSFPTVRSVWTSSTTRRPSRLTIVLGRRSRTEKLSAIFTRRRNDLPAELSWTITWRKNTERRKEASTFPAVSVRRNSCWKTIYWNTWEMSTNREETNTFVQHVESSFTTRTISGITFQCIMESWPTSVLKSPVTRPTPHWRLSKSTRSWLTR